MLESKIGVLYQDQWFFTDFIVTNVPLASQWNLTENKKSSTGNKQPIFLGSIFFFNENLFI